LSVLSLAGKASIEFYVKGLELLKAQYDQLPAERNTNNNNDGNEASMRD
jgi:hypothetical protein